MKVIILVGLPGSGKSSFRKKYNNYEYINQDQLGNRKACITKFKEYLSLKKNVIIDRTNINKLQRKHFIDIAKDFNIDEINCIYLDVNPEECIRRIQQRKGHETITEETTLDKIKEIVYSFVRSYEVPELSEGFNKILFMRN